MLSRLLTRAAAALGHTARLGGRYGAGLAGAAAIAIGVGMFDVRIGLIVAGAALLFLDGKAH